MRSRSYRGNSFEVWNGQRTWFWLVDNPHRNGGTIGAAPTEVAAMREACALIEDMSAQDRADAAGPCAAREAAVVVMGWEHSLADLERYLVGASGANA
ncbi:MAG TPA: hypothetical protein VJX23_11625 [Candidatus Binataceae bacterium]|nr:hypothetical protein [Candidatus Binataceae bacterium]